MKDIRSIGAATKVCAVIGSPIGHSLSPAIHNAAYLALDLDYIYVAFEVSDLKSAVAGFQALGNFRGLSVTIPHKIEVMKYMDIIDPVDRSIGAINTVICEKDQLIGLGTDGPGALKAVEDGNVILDGKNILIIGSGGVARAITFTLARNADPAALSLLDINMELLQNLSSDVVYTPLETKLLADAKAHGLQVISGVEMFINQAVLQFEKFTGLDAPVEVMRKVVMEHLNR
jgi:shikimate dehydrogenase